MYKALYRKWRPVRFSDVVGQEAIVTALENQIKANRLGHAYLFTGTRGTGKTTCAKIFAKAVNCENPQDGFEPCGICDCCAGLENGSILDVAEIDAASNNGVDDVRDLRDETAYRPSRCKYKVYIIDEVHMLSPQAFNALLKIMEEPPSHVIFILATTEIHKIPATILSRCQRFDFLRIPAEKIAQRLQLVADEDGIDLAPAAAALIARLADGAMRDALSLLDTCSGAAETVDEDTVRRMAGVADRDYLFQMSDAVNTGDVAAIIGLVTELRNKSIDVKRLAEEMVFHYRNFILAKAAPDGSLLESLSETERARYTAAAAGVPDAFPLKAVARLATALDRISRAPEPRVELELALFELSAEKDAPENAAAVAAPLPVRQATSEPSAQTKQLAQSNTPPAAPVADASGQAMFALPEQPAPQAGAAPATSFDAWPEIVRAMAARDAMLYTYMKKTKAALSGVRLDIYGSDVFVDIVERDDVAAAKIKTHIAEATGQTYDVVFRREEGQAPPQDTSAQTTLQEWKNMGLPIHDLTES